MPEHKVGTHEEWLAASCSNARTSSPSAARTRAPDGVVHHTCSRAAPDRDFVVPSYHQLLDRPPKGRQDEFRATRRDEYQ